MSPATTMQPDQDASRWDAYAAPYEHVFEPLTTAFATQVLDALEPLAGQTLLDVAAGAGGAALAAQHRGARVLAVDGSGAMVRRMQARGLTARVMDGAALAVPNAAFDIAFSSFGVVLFPDPASGMAELHRVVCPGGQVAVITWTQPHRYALAARLRDAVIAVRGAPLPGDLPAQLRFVDPDTLRSLVEGAGFSNARILTLEAELVAPDATALAGALAFAPGMAAMLEALGADRASVLAEFTTRLIAEHGPGEIRLGAVAHASLAVRT